ncbi:MAG: phosphate ABC transporter permease subunit PstC [Candidatus Eisenbacteria sp.]|nr:phosphate ABC transporter permease subunit PstC [Candidatus Eisenbacteria bacterium]
MSPRALRSELLLSGRASRSNRLVALAGQGTLLLITSCSAIVVLFLFYFIFKDALPFFQLRGIAEFLGSTRWYPSGHPPEFGSLAIFFGTGLVTLGAVLFAVPLGVSAAVCLSDILPFTLRQAVKPMIEMLAAIPSVAYGFFALVVFAPFLQDSGGALLSVVIWVIGIPASVLAMVVTNGWIVSRLGMEARPIMRLLIMMPFGVTAIWVLYHLSASLAELEISSGTNALNVSIILGIMALPTVVSVSEDALQAVGRQLREGSYALGATRAETILKVVIPAADRGILAAIILGIMRVIGETMVVWMASGNAAQIPEPWFNFLQPIRTLTATIAGDMGEADHVTGSARYHVLFAMAFSLLVISFTCNLASEWFVRRAGHKSSGRCP